MNHSILITGGGGFIGSHIVRVFPGAFKLNREYLFDQKKLTALCKKIQPSVIIHLAAYGTSEDQKDLALIEKVNIHGTLNLLEATKDISYTAFINTGSSSEYGFKKKPMKETDVLEPISFYGASKAAATLLCQTFAKLFHKPIMTLRPFSVYGPGEPPNRFIPTIIRAVKNNTPIMVTKEPVRRDFIYIDDVVSAYKLAIEKASQFCGEIFNIGTGYQYTNREVIQKLFHIAHASVPISDFPKRYWDTDYWKADITKAKNMLGWEPIYSLAQGLKKIMNHEP